MKLKVHFDKKFIGAGVLLLVLTAVVVISVSYIGKKASLKAMSDNLVPLKSYLLHEDRTIDLVSENSKDNLSMSSSVSYYKVNETGEIDKVDDNIFVSDLSMSPVVFALNSSKDFLLYSINRLEVGSVNDFIEIEGIDSKCRILEIEDCILVDFYNPNPRMNEVLSFDNDGNVKEDDTLKYVLDLSFENFSVKIDKIEDVSKVITNLLTYIDKK